MGEVWGRELPATQKIVLLALADHADQEGVCWPGQERLATVTGLSVRTVRTTLKSLEEEGLIGVEPRFDGSGKRVGTVYRVARKELPGTPQGGPANSAGSHAQGPAKEKSGPAGAAAKPVIKTTTKNPSFSSVQEVFDYWVGVMEKHRAKLNGKRRAKIEQRLREGYTVEDLKAAIDGCASSSWHMGDNPDRKVWNDLELICRDGSKVESFAELTNHKKKQNESWGRYVA